MPPEQFQGAARVDARADLYAAGVVAFKLLTGTLPFLAGSRGAVMQAKVKGQPLSLEQATDAAWPQKLEGFLRCALARDPNERFQSASAMLTAWRDATEAVDIPGVDLLRRRLAGSQDTDDTVIEASAEGTL
jgi:eukaryotic-like serine/threonine-protein kinase